MTPEEFSALERRVHAICRPDGQLLFLYALTSLGTLCAAPLVFFISYLRYHTLWYRFDGTGVSMGYGALMRFESQLTYERMQDIHLSQNIFERWLGIGTVTVQTAGAGEASSMKIVGVRDFNAIRDYLYIKMRGVREKPQQQQQQETSIDATLLEIRDALHETARALREKD